MYKKIANVMVIAALLSLVLSACKLPASTPSAAQASPTVEFPMPDGTSQPDVMKEILSGTQTAAALLNPESQATPEPTKKVTKAVVATKKPSGGSSGNVTTPERPTKYTVNKGDHFLCLARRFNVNPEDLRSQNGFSSYPNTLTPGQSLKIPQSGSWPSSLGSRALRDHPASYTVAAGDTLYSIACKFGDVYPEQIMQANGMSGTTVKTGAKLDIP